MNKFINTKIFRANYSAFVNPRTVGEYCENFFYVNQTDPIDCKDAAENLMY